MPAAVAMNPAALVVNIKDLRSGGIVVVNTGQFSEGDLRKANLATNPLVDGSLKGYRVLEIDINQRVTEALAGTEARDTENRHGAGQDRQDRHERQRLADLPEALQKRLHQAGDVDGRDVGESIE